MFVRARPCLGEKSRGHNPFWDSIKRKVLPASSSLLHLQKVESRTLSWSLRSGVCTPPWHDWGMLPESASSKKNAISGHRSFHSQNQTHSRGSCSKLAGKKICASATKALNHIPRIPPKQPSTLGLGPVLSCANTMATVRGACV